MDSQGRVLRELSRTDAIPGRDVQLTLDLRVQALAEDTLAQSLLLARTRTPEDNPNRFAAPAGSVVVLDPNDGSIVAMASYPTFDPREFIGGIATDRYEALLDPANNFPLTNRAIAGQYAPGSTFKVITATAGLAAGVVSSGTQFLDSGSYTVPDCTGERCTFSNAGGQQNGWVTLPTALAASSDVFFYSIGADLWRFRDRYDLAIQDTATNYGFGAETGVALPGEQAGRVPTPEQKQALHDENPTAFPFGQWFTGDNVNLAVGQGEMLATPLQLANAYAAFSNGGTVYSPNIAMRVAEAASLDGGVPQIDRQIGPRVLRTIGLTANVRDPILAGLIGAVRSSDGTASPGVLRFSARSVSDRRQDRHRADRREGSRVRHVAVRGLRPGRCASLCRGRRARAVRLRCRRRRARRAADLREPRRLRAVARGAGGSADRACRRRSSSRDW